MAKNISELSSFSANDVPKIVETKCWNIDSIRMLCIKEQWYTKGTIKEYDEMFNFITSHEPTPSNIYLVAKDIYTHSDIKQFQLGDDKKEILEIIMYKINNECDVTFNIMEENI